MTTFVNARRILLITAAGLVMLGAGMLPRAAMAQASDICVNCAKGCCEVTTTECPFGETDPTKCKQITEFACCKLSVTGAHPAALDSAGQLPTLELGTTQPPPPKTQIWRNTLEPATRR
jgi:hypothetical protein